MNTILSSKLYAFMVSTAEQSGKTLAWQLHKKQYNSSITQRERLDHTKSIPDLPTNALVPSYFFFPSPSPLKEREDENIQKRDWPFGPSLRNSWPRPLPHLPQDTFRAMGDSSYLETLSGRTVEVKAGQGEECSNLVVL